MGVELIYGEWDKMDNKIIYILIIAVAIVAAAGILAYGMMNANHEKVIIVNNTTGNNINSSVNATPVNQKDVSSSNEPKSENTYNDNPKNLPKSKSQIQNEYESSGHGYEGSIAQSQGISESDYWNDIYSHQ